MEDRKHSSENEKKEREILEAWKDVLTPGGPNPQRIGCVDKDLLWKLATNSKAFRSNPRADSVLEHLSDCAPCEKELGEMMRKADSRRSFLRKLLWLGIAASLLLAVVTFFFLWK